MAKNNEKLREKLLEIVNLDDTLSELIELKSLEKTYPKTEFYKETRMPLVEVYKLEKQNYLLKGDFVKKVFNEENVPTVVEFVKKVVAALSSEEAADALVNTLNLDEFKEGTETLNKYLELFAPLLKK